MKTKCPRCSAVYSIPEPAPKRLGKQAFCGKCQQTFRLVAWDPEESAALEEPPLFVPREEGDACAPAWPEAETIPQIIPSLPPPGRIAMARPGKSGVAAPQTRSDRRSDRSYARLAVLGAAIAGSLLMLALAVYLLWPASPTQDLAQGASTTPLPSVPKDAMGDNRASLVNSPSRSESVAEVSPRQRRPPAPPTSASATSEPSVAQPSAAPAPSTPLPPPAAAAGRVDARKPPSGTSGDQPPEAVHPPPAIKQLAQESVALIRTPLAAGTGFAVAENILATNRHVIQGAFVDELTVSFVEAGDKRLKVARIVYEDWPRDLCLLEVPMDRAPLPIAQDYKWTREKVTLIGNPAAGGGITLRNVMSPGTLISLVTIDGYDFYQFEATVDHGCSGGPALNAAGQVIAVVARKASDEITSELRKRMQELGETFDRPTGTQDQAGLTYGIPGQTLAEAMASLQEQASSANEVDARHAARVVLQRTATLGHLYLLETMLDTPPEVREEWRQFRLRNLKADRPADTDDKRPRVDLPPEEVVTKLRTELQSPEARQMIDVCLQDLPDRVSALHDNQYVDDAVKKDLQGLYNRMRLLEKTAKRPPKKYDDFSARVVSGQQSLNEYISRLAIALAMRPPDSGK